jgi:hypothetical protein
MSGPISLVPGGYPPEFVDAMEFSRKEILGYLADVVLPMEVDSPSTLVDVVTNQMDRAISLAFMMGAQWAQENPHMPIDRKPK